MRYFTAAAPGLDELTIMGKIEFLRRESRVGPNGPPFDLLIFDAPATGHGLAFFNVPRTAMSMTRMGPLHAKAERMWRLLSDPARTALNIVTLPEEMSVNEAIDLRHGRRDDGAPARRGRGERRLSGFLSRRARRAAQPCASGCRRRTSPAGRVSRAALDRALSSVVRREARRSDDRQARPRAAPAAHRPAADLHAADWSGGARNARRPVRRGRPMTPARRRRRREPRRPGADQARHRVRRQRGRRQDDDVGGDCAEGGVARTARPAC